MKNTHTASNNFFGGFLLLGLLGTFLVSCDWDSLAHLCQSFEHEWQNFMLKMSAVMGQPHRGNW
ncbi:MAG: hypothetical protein H7246_16125 [Phycisphaerae bacterium]|nr:hypothetical protein [Saprospiraceae bacterium]